MPTISTNIETPLFLQMARHNITDFSQALFIVAFESPKQNNAEIFT
jgi:hypothetical protein